MKPESSQSTSIALKVFYALKPILPRLVQLNLRRWRSALILRQTKQWPIADAAAERPVQFAGWPDAKKFAFILTHDVETAGGLGIVMRVAELEKQHGLRSCFNFVAQDYTTPENMRRQLIQTGFEVGVHGLRHNRAMYRSELHFKRHARQINNVLKSWGSVGFRSPAMFHNLDWNHSLNIRYDASTFDTDPFEPQSDGVLTIFPFVVRNRSGVGCYVELPYTLPQDFTLFTILQQKSPEIWKTKLDWVAQNGGMALLLVHPDYLSFDGRPKQDQYPAEYFADFLQYVEQKYKNQYWNALPREIADFWLDNCAEKNLLTHDRRETMSGRRRICMPTYSFYESDNRVQRYAKTLAREGDSVDVICLRRKGQPRFERAGNVNVFRIQHRTKNEAGALSYLFKIFWFLFKSGVILSWKQMRRRYDLVHVHNIPDLEVFAAVVPRLMGVKVILDIHDIVPELFCSKFGSGENSRIFRMMCAVEKASARFADHVIISNGLWQKKVCVRSVPPGKCSVFINYPDTEIFNAIRRPVIGDKTLFVYPGTLNWHQGVDVAIRALALIKDRLPDAEFRIHGEGPAREALIKLADELGLRDCVVFAKFLPIGQVADVMAQSKFGIVPKRADTFGNEAFSTKILEFMALGIPVIAAETAIDRFYFNDSQVLFFKSGDEKELARKILLLAEDEALRQKLLTGSRRFLEQNCWEQKKREYLALVGRLVDGVDEGETIPYKDVRRSEVAEGEPQRRGEMG